MRRVVRIVTAPAVTPVSLAEVKLQSRVTFTDDDAAITIYLNAAVLLCEQILQRKLITQTWKMWLDYWPSWVTVLFGDLQSVTHVKYTDDDGVQATLDSSTYDVDINSVPGRIVLKSGQTWPSTTLHAVNPIEIQFVTGYGVAAAVPEDIRNAVLLTAAHLYENRENYLVAPAGDFAVEMIPGTANTLLSNHRVWEWIL